MAKKPTKIDPKSAVPLPATVINDRLTLVVNITHEHYGDQPFGLQSIYQQQLQTKEQVYSRRYKATEEWAAIDLNWLADNGISLVVVENLEGKGLLVNPTKEERDATALRVLEVSYTQNSDEADLVPPTGICIKTPAVPDSIYIRCRKGEANYRLTLIPG